MESARLQREQNRSEPVPGGTQKARPQVMTVAGGPLSLNDAHSPALRLDHAFGASHTPLPFPLQAKLTINEPGDQYEQEADRVAEKVMQLPHTALRVQRKCGCGGSTSAGESCQECASSSVQVQRRALSSSESSMSAPEVVHDTLRSPGHELDQDTRDFFEQRFQQDFSHVRIHTDERASESARSVNAQAYTVGRDVVFGSQLYAPGTVSGRKLLAHELAHVVQQNGHRGIQSGELHPGASDHAAEAKAERFPQGVPGVAVKAGLASTGSKLQRQFAHSLGAGGGFGGLMERDRRAAGGRPVAARFPAPSADSCNFQLCFLPLSLLLERGVDPDLAYAAATHTFIRWDGNSVGFTRYPNESIADARVISPEPRAGEPHERCLRARFRTVPLPTPGQLISFSPLDAFGDLVSYGIDVVRGFQHCPEPSCAQARRRITRLLTDDRRGLYDLFDDNCEHWARNVLAAACLEAPEFRLGGIGNQLVRILNETTPGRLYRGARRALDQTRPLPQPGP